MLWTVFKHQVKIWCKAVVLVLFVLCGAIRLLAVGLLLYFVNFVALTLFLVGPVTPVWQHCEHLVWEEGAGGIVKFSFVRNTRTVCCSLFTLRVGDLGRQYSVIVALSGYLLYHFPG